MIVILTFAMRCFQLPADSKRPEVIAVQLQHVYSVVKEALE